MKLRKNAKVFSLERFLLYRTSHRLASCVIVSRFRAALDLDA